MTKRLKPLLFALVVFFHLDGKAQFREVYTEGNPGFWIVGISFISGSTGYIATTNFIGFTQDSGRNFVRKHITPFNVDYNGYLPPFSVGFWPVGIQALHQDTLFVFGHIDNAPSILYSANGGNSWKLVHYTPYRVGASEENQGITDLKIQKNGNIGYAVHHDQVLKTTNRGQTWTVVGNFYEEKLGSITSAQFNTLYVVGRNKVFKSITAGGNWSTLTINVPGFTSPRGAQFFTPFRGFLTGNKLLFTTDGGLSWTVKGDGRSSYFINDTIGLAIADSFTIDKTFDGGKVWEPVPRDNNYETQFFNFFTSWYFLNDSLVWAGGGDNHLELSTNLGGMPYPQARFHIDTSLVPAQGILQFKNEGRTVYQYRWYRNSQLFAHTYDASYFTPRIEIDTVMLVVTNGIYSDTNVMIFDTRIPHTPSAAFTFVKDTSTVKFFATDTYSTVRHYWDFGDGIKDSTSLNPIHQYNTIGNYIVKHVAITPIDGRKDSVAKEVNVTSIYFCVPADYSFTADPFFVNKYTFTPIGTYPSITWMDWDWGDGTAHSGNYSATHSFDSAKTFQVCMKMRNNTGCTTTVCKNVTVNFRTDCYPGIQMIGGTPGNPCHFDIVTPAFSEGKQHTWILDNRDTIVTGSSGYLQKNYAQKGPPEYLWFNEPYQTFRYSFDPDSIHRKLKHIVYDSISGCQASFDTSFTLKYKIPHVKMYFQKHPLVPNFVNIIAIDSSLSHTNGIYPRAWRVSPWIGGSGGQQFGPGSVYLGNVLSWNFESVGIYRVAFVPEQPAYPGPLDVYEIFINIDTVVACPQQPNFSHTIDPADSSKVNFIGTINYFGDYNIGTVKFFFGDGDSAVSDIPSHEYATSGIFNVCMKYTNLNGCVKQFCKEIEIKKSIDLVLCPYRNFSLISRVSGNSYQWQVNNGSGWVNINDNVLYQGTNNDTLNFVAPPSSLYGYKYRCVVTQPGKTLYNHEYVLKFQVEWTGSFNTQWEHGSNWSCWVPPDENTDVVIEANGITPEISSNVICRSLTVKSGATVIVHSGYTLTIKK